MVKQQKNSHLIRDVLYHLISVLFRSISQCNYKGEKKVKILKQKKETKLSIFADDVIIYQENLRDE